MAARVKVSVLWLIKGLGAGGAERLLVSAARIGDHRTFHYSAAYVVPEKDALVPGLVEHGVHAYCLGGHGRWRPWPMMLRKELRRGCYGIVHLHSPLVAGVARLVVRSLPRNRRPVVVSTEHNTWDSYSPFTRLLNAALHRTDAHRWAVSRRVRESMWGPFRPGVEVLVHGIVLDDVQTHRTRQATRDALGLDQHDVVAVTVANFRTGKAYPDLLRAMATALAEQPRLRHLVVGQGPLEAEIRSEHARLGLGERCRILGYRDDVMDILHACDIFVLASHHEGFPVAVMEAMAVGLPVVATRVGGIPDAVDQGVQGLLVEPGSPDALARALCLVASDDELRRRMAGAAKERGMSFDAHRAVSRTEAAYAQAYERHRSRAASQMRRPWPSRVGGQAARSRSHDSEG